MTADRDYLMRRPPVDERDRMAAVGAGWLKAVVRPTRDPLELTLRGRAYPKAMITILHDADWALV